MTYGDFKDLARRTASDKIMCDKAFNSAKDPKYDGYQIVLASMVYRFFNKKLLVAVLKMRICQTSNQQKNYTTNYQKIQVKKTTITFYRQYFG